MSDSEEAPAESEDTPTESDGSEDIDALREERDRLEERVAELEAERDELIEERDDLEARVKRTAADFENYKKRQEKRREQERAAATEQLIERLLNVRDNLTRALEEPEGDGESLREGVELTLNEFDRVLDAEDVSEISPEPGDSVDPERHEVMMRVDGEHDDGEIEEIYRLGYAIDEKVIRPAQVAVGTDEDTDDR